MIYLHSVECQNSSISNNSVLRKYAVLFDPLIGLYSVLPLRTWMDKRVMAIKGYSAFPKVPVFLEPHHEIFVSYQDTRWECLNALQRRSCIFFYTPSQLGQIFRFYCFIYLCSPRVSDFVFFRLEWSSLVAFIVKIVLIGMWSFINL